MTPIPSFPPTAPPSFRLASLFKLRPAGRRWPFATRAALVSGPMRFNVLNKTIEGLSAKVLSRVLKELERDGMVTRSVFPTVPVAVEYDLTALGHALSRTLHGLSYWAVENIEAVQAVPAAI